MTESEILIVVAITLAFLIFLGCLAVLAVLARKEVHKFDGSRSPEWRHLNAVMDEEDWDSPRYRAAFDTWAASVGLGESPR